MTPRSAKAKGRRGVQQVQEALYRAFPDLEPTDLVRPAGSQPGVDLILSPAAQRLIGPLAIEVKCAERESIRAWMRQACANAGPGQMPIVAHSRNRDEMLVTLRIVDFLALRRNLANR